MSTIIAGRFEQQDHAKAARDALIDAGFSPDEVTSFFINPAGQHSLHELGGDEDKSAGADDSVGGAVVGTSVGGAVGLAVGLATLPFFGPAAVIVGAGAGAYAGSLLGALETMHKEGPGSGAPSDETTPRHSGMLVAVHTPSAEAQSRAVGVFQAHHAADVELADGVIAGGQWNNFDPRAPVKLIAHAAPSA